MKPSSMACRMEYRLNGGRPVPGSGVLNNSSVFAFGVAVKAKKLTFRSRPRRRMAASTAALTASSWSGCSAASSLAASSRLLAVRTSFMLRCVSPDCEEWASSMTTANRCPGISPIFSVTNGNVCRVVMMMSFPLISASASSCDLCFSMAVTMPFTCSKLRVVHPDEPVAKPGDGVGFAGAGAMFDQVVLPRAVLAGMRDQAPHGIELVIARKNHLALAGFFAIFVDLVPIHQEVVQNLQQRVPAPDLFPQVCGLEAVGVRRIAGGAIVPFVEGKEPDRKSTR